MNDTTTEKPELTKQGLTFFPIPVFDGPAQAFGADLAAYFPRSSRPDVPRKYEAMAESLFFKGGELPEELQPEVDHGKAMAAVRAWLTSFAPPHECKTATVAYAFWVWCEGDLSGASAPVVEQ